MSLTSFLKQKDVRQRFAEEFPVPAISMKGTMVAPPNTDRYALMGTAFDYLLRFFLETINHSVTRPWVAELAIKYIHKATDDIDVLDKAVEMLLTALTEHSAYLETRLLTDEVIMSCIHLAQLDAIFRSGRITEDFGLVVPADIDDLRNLILNVTPADFIAHNHCYLNPTFGVGSQIVGGADADLLIDHTLIEIKTTKYLNMKPEYYYQLIGYCLLSEINEDRNEYEGREVQLPEITKLGIYYSRHARLYTFPVAEITDDFGRWFIERALPRRVLEHDI